METKKKKFQGYALFIICVGYYLSIMGMITSLYLSIFGDTINIRVTGTVLLVGLIYWFIGYRRELSISCYKIKYIL